MPPQTRLGRYTIRSQIGTGGMGEVYLAWDNELHRVVALKLLSAEVASDQQRMKRFIQEARSASALNHPNIITIYEIGKVDGTHFIVTEFIDGITLRQQMAAARLEISEVLDVAVQIASALTAAHQAGIIHRDIKPENIMVRRDSLVKVLDFGLAKLTNKTAERGMVNSGAETKMRVNTNPGMVMGTVSYMSPEQARGLEIDARTDIFSLGVVLYELVAGRRPFEGVTTNHIVVSIMEKEPAPVTRYRPEVPAELERIISKALQKKRNERYQGVRDMEIDLKRLKQRLEFEAELERTYTPEESREKMAASAGALEVNAESPRDGTAFAEGVSHPSQPSRPNNLSEELSPLIGRAQEIASVEMLLRQQAIRLLTLTGIAGTGKTRLAQHVAQELLPEFADGVFFVDLSTISDPELVVSAVAQPLGVKEAGSTPLRESINEHLRERQMLLVLDNFEQVTAAAPLVAELLAASPGLKVLATSRALLHLSAEHEFSVPPLELPTSRRLPPAGELMEYASVALFVERACAVKPNFSLTEENARPVAEICQRLDGLPLAIELAAARVKLLSPQAILSRLENRLKLLTGGARDLPARQQTMRGAISWSYDLLEEDEKKLLQRLSIFAGGFTLEAAEAVCNPEEDLRVEVLDGVASLVDKSLVAQKEEPDGESRFRMLEVVREYGLESLEESGEAEEIRREHAHHFLSLAEEGEPEMEGANPAGWLERLEQEHDNLRAALHWAEGNDPETGLRLAGALQVFWSTRGHLTEGRSWMERALKAGGDKASPARAKVLGGAGTVAWQQGDLESARTFYEEGLRVSREAGDRQQVAINCNGLGIVNFMQGDSVAGRLMWEESLTISRETGDQKLAARVLNNLGEAARSEGNLEAARAFYEESLAGHMQRTRKDLMSTTYGNLGIVAYLQGDYEAARSHFREALTISHELGNKRIISAALDGFAALCVKRREPERAARLAGAAEALRETIGYETGPIDREFRDRYVVEAREALGDEAFSRSYAAGQSLRLKEAIALARE